MKKILTLIPFTLLTSQNLAASVGHAYVSNKENDTVSVIDISTNTVTATITVGTHPYISGVTPDGKYLYVPNIDSGNISVIDTLQNAVIATITVTGGLPVSVVALNNGKAYTILYNRSANSLVTVINTANQQIIETIGLPSTYGTAMALLHKSI